MTLATISTLLLLFTLLQRCSAEIATDQPTWYAANAINDPGFLPKPLSDIFPTDKTFSTVSNNLINNPIVVLSSTTATSTGRASTTTSEVTSFEPRISTSTINTPTVNTPTRTPRPSSIPPNIPTSTFTTFIPSTTEGQTEKLPRIQLTRGQILQSQPILPNLDGINSGAPNYLFVYQQGTQPIPTLNQNLPPFINDQSTVTAFPCAASTVQTIPQTVAPQVTVSTTTAPQQVTSSPPPPFSQQGSQFNPQQAAPFFPQGTPFPPGGPFPLGGPLPPGGLFPPGGPIPPGGSFSTGPFPAGIPALNQGTPANPSSTQIPQATQAPPTNGSVATIPFVRIRMQSPSGSITSVNLIPVTSTTKRPTTTRRRRRRNNYDDCVEACGSRRIPICAAPLATRPINPDNLKGFPSICHMACHNSFRKNVYEKVIDGRCGRLRTRIQTVDTGNKLKRDELNRVQYTVVQNPNTVIEFAPMLCPSCPTA